MTNVVLADPRRWKREHVTQWLYWVIREFSLEGVVTDNFDLDGRALCALTKEEFRNRAPPYVDDIMWDHLETMKKGERSGVPVGCRKR